ncbi:phosphotransferase [Streptomyces sp. M10(2022)]
MGQEASRPRLPPGVLAGSALARCRRRPWWAALGRALQSSDAQPVVRLHGDLKPEHLLVDGADLHVVDWEASARGPAAVDYTDVIFHLVRDLLYGDVPPGHVPVDLLTTMPFSGPVLAWRLLLWLDRRRPRDIDLVSTHDVCRLAGEEQAAGYRSLARSVALLRAAGVPADSCFTTHPGALTPALVPSCPL